MGVAFEGGNGNQDWKLKSELARPRSGACGEYPLNGDVMEEIKMVSLKRLTGLAGGF